MPISNHTFTARLCLKAMDKKGLAVMIGAAFLVSLLMAKPNFSLPLLLGNMLTFSLVSVFVFHLSQRMQSKSYVQIKINEGVLSLHNHRVTLWHKSLSALESIEIEKRKQALNLVQTVLLLGAKDGDSYVLPLDGWCFDEGSHEEVLAQLQALLPASSAAKKAADPS